MSNILHELKKYVHWEDGVINKPCTQTLHLNVKMHELRKYLDRNQKVCIIMTSIILCYLSECNSILRNQWPILSNIEDIYFSPISRTASKMDQYKGKVGICFWFQHTSRETQIEVNLWSVKQTVSFWWDYDTHVVWLLCWPYCV